MEDYWSMVHLHDLIKIYFMLGLKCSEILQLLNTVDDIIINMCTDRF